MRAAHRGGLLGGLDAGEAGQGAPGGAGQDRGRGALHRRRGRRPLPRRARRAASRAGLPESFLEPVEDALVSLVRRYAATHVPVPHQAARRPLRGRSELGAEGAGAVRRRGPRRAPARRHVARVVRGRRTAAPAPRQPRPAAPGGRGDRPARAGPVPAELAERRRPRPRRRRPGSPARGARLAPGSGAHAEDLGARRAAPAPRLLQPEPGSTSSAPAASWSGSAPGRSAATTARSLSTSARTCGWPARRRRTPRSTRPEGEIHDAIRERLGQGPCFWLDLLELDGSAEELHEALWDLAWSGEVTNDAFAPLRAPRLRAAQRSDRGGRRFARRRAAAAGTVIGRWSLSAPLFEGAPSSGPADARPGRADARAPRDRHPRDRDRRGHPRRLRLDLRRAVRTSSCSGRRGAATSSRGSAAPSSPCPGAVERLRSLPQADGSLQVLAATDPANPYGATLSWPKLEGQRRPARTAGRLRDAARRRAAALRRARRQGDPAAPEARRRRARRGAGRAGLRAPRTGRSRSSRSSASTASR